MHALSAHSFCTIRGNIGACLGIKACILHARIARRKWLRVILHTHRHIFTCSGSAQWCVQRCGRVVCQMAVIRCRWLGCQARSKALRGNTMPLLRRTPCQQPSRQTQADNTNRKTDGHALSSFLTARAPPPAWFILADHKPDWRCSSTRPVTVPARLAWVGACHRQSQPGGHHHQMSVLHVRHHVIVQHW